MKLEHRIGIQAPAEVIWEIVADIPGWAAWNPLYPKAAGEIRIGNVLDLELHLPGQKPQAIQPVVLDWAPFDHLHWTLRLKRGLVKTTRYLEIEALSETGCIFSNGEIFDGWMGPGMARRLRRPIRAGFAALGEAVRDRAEATWRQRQEVTK